MYIMIKKKQVWDIRIRDDRFPDPGASIGSCHGLKRVLPCHLRQSMNLSGPGILIFLVLKICYLRYRRAPPCEHVQSVRNISNARSALFSAASFYIDTHSK